MKSEMKIDISDRNMIRDAVVLGKQGFVNQHKSQFEVEYLQTVWHTLKKSTFGQQLTAGGLSLTRYEATEQENKEHYDTLRKAGVKLLENGRTEKQEEKDAEKEKKSKGSTEQQVRDCLAQGITQPKKISELTGAHPSYISVLKAKIQKP